MIAMNKYMIRLLREQLSVGQLLGFVLANVVGLTILLLGIQFYSDVGALLSESGQIMRGDQIILSKRVSTAQMMLGGSNQFSERELTRLSEQSFVRSLSIFTPAQFRVTAGLNMGMQVYSYMFLESVPDECLDVKPEQWFYDAEQRLIPIIIPRTYLTLYNAAFSQTQGLPLLSEKSLEMVGLQIELSGMGKSDVYTGRIVGFSDRLNTILVPHQFMLWANKYYAAKEQTDIRPSRIILNVENPADQGLLAYVAQHNYQVEGAALDSGGANYLLRIVAGIVSAVGLIISLLSVYLLVLSLYLLLQKNTQQLENLLLLGYSRRSVGLPYQALVVALSLGALVISLAMVYCSRGYYMELVMRVFPSQNGGVLWPTALLGLVLVGLFAAISSMAIARRIKQIPAFFRG